jgi:hypothetical protein
VADKTGPCEDVLIDTNANCIIQRNLFSSSGSPYLVKSRKNTVHIVNNVIGKGAKACKGCTTQEFSFNDKSSGDYSTALNCGAEGWAATGGDIHPEKKETSQKMKPVNKSYDKKESPVDGLINEIDEKEIYVRSLFLDAEADNMVEEENDSTSDEPPNEDGMIDFSDWD